MCAPRAIKSATFHRLLSPHRFWVLGSLRSPIPQPLPILNDWLSSIPSTVIKLVRSSYRCESQQPSSPSNSAHPCALQPMKISPFYSITIPPVAVPFALVMPGCQSTTDADPNNAVTPWLKVRRLVWLSSLCLSASTYGLPCLRIERAHWDWLLDTHMTDGQVSSGTFQAA